MRAVRHWCAVSQLGSDFQRSKGRGPRGHGPEANRTVLKGFDVVLYLKQVWEWREGISTRWRREVTCRWFLVFIGWIRGLIPGGSDGKSICLQCGRPGFDPWVGQIPWRRKWQPTPVLLPGKSHGQRSLAGCGPWVAKSRTQLRDFTFTFRGLKWGCDWWRSQVAI